MITIERGESGFKVIDNVSEEAESGPYYIGDFKELLKLLDQLLDTSVKPGRPRGSRNRKAKKTEEANAS
jgi:hypothetical protein